MQNSITLFDQSIRTDSEGRYSLNDLHKAAMMNGHASDAHKPSAFLRNASVKAFIEQAQLEAQNSPIIKTVKGRGITGTYGNRLVALRYAGWISSVVEVEVYRTFEKVVDAEEELTADMIDRQTDRSASERLAIRAQGKVTRNAFTETLQQHGVKGAGFAQCTNSIYQELFGATAKKLRDQRGLPEKANVRENMSRMELVASMFAEEVASDRIKKNDANGNIECAKHSRDAALETRRVIDNVKIE